MLTSVARPIHCIAISTKCIGVHRCIVYIHKTKLGIYLSTGRPDGSIVTIYNASNLEPGSYKMEIILNKGLEDEFIFRRYFEIFSNPLSCGIILTGAEGISFKGGHLSVNFGVTGLYDDFTCLTNDSPTPCECNGL